MFLSWTAIILLGILSLSFVSLNLYLSKTSYLLNLKFATEVKQPFNPNLMPKAITIEDLNNLARGYCEKAQAIVIQCIEKHITNPYAPLGSFCQDVIDQTQAGRDLTTDVQYLWGYLPNSSGLVSEIYSSPTTNQLVQVNDLPLYIRYLWIKDIPQVYTNYFSPINILQFYYHKPEDARNPTPCAYSGVIIPPPSS